MNQIPTAPEPSPTKGVFGALDELLRRPAVLMSRIGAPGPLPIVPLLVGAAICITAFGVASGFFQGGAQILVTAVKAPLIVFGSVLLCLPSFYVVTSLSGIEVSPRWFAVVVSGFSAMIGLLLAALVPIAWLFSVSSTSLGFMIFVHLVIWVSTLGFALRFLYHAADGRGSFALVLWSILFLIVSFQVTSQLRPVLWRPDGMAPLAPRKVIFLEHLGRISTGKEGPTATSPGEGD